MEMSNLFINTCYHGCQNCTIPLIFIDYFTFQNVSYFLYGKNDILSIIIIIVERFL